MLVLVSPYSFCHATKRSFLLPNSSETLGDFPPQDASSLHKADSSVPSQDLFSQPEGNRSTVERNNVTRLNYNVHHPVRRLNRHESYEYTGEEKNVVIAILLFTALH